MHWERLSGSSQIVAVLEASLVAAGCSSNRDPQHSSDSATAGAGDGGTLGGGIGGSGVGGRPIASATEAGAGTIGASSGQASTQGGESFLQAGSTSLELVGSAGNNGGVIGLGGVGNSGGGVGNSGGGAATVKPRLLAALEELCRNAGGSFTDYECRCPAGEPSSASGTKARVFSTDSGGQCQSVQLVSSTCMTNGFTSVLNTSGSSALKNCLRGNLLRVGGTAFQVSSAYPEELEVELAAWLDEWVRAGKLLVNLPSHPGNAQTVVLRFGFPEPSELPFLIDSVPYPMPGAAPLSVILSRPVYAKRVADIPAVLGAVEHSAPVSADGVPEPLALLLRAIGAANFEAATKYTEEPLSNGCEGACNETAEFSLAEADGRYLVRRTRRYHGGTVYAESLTLTTENARRLLGWADFDLAGQPNLLATFRYTDKPFETVATTFDYELEQLGNAAFDSGAVANYDELTKTISAGSTTLAGNDVAILVCETNMGSAIDSALAPATLIGPHRGQAGTDGRSFLGWLMPDANDLHGYWSGVLSTTFSMPAYDSFKVTHAREVAGLALGVDAAGSPSSGFRLLPVSAETCVFEPAVLKEIAERSDSAQIRVVSLSATLPIDHVACDELYPAGVDSHYLWVVASGNAGRTFETLETTLNCPQALSRRNNLVVVDGADGEQVMEAADRGRFYSDIAADCRNESGLCTGTSLSAPRVAYVAAQIIREYLTAISNPMVRMAILLTATMSATSFDNRSSGVLNAPDALAMARRLVEKGLGERGTLSAAEARTLLLEMYSSEPALVEKRVATLQDNGLFEE